jgi:hypothetical protein
MTKLEKYLKDYSMLDITSVEQWQEDIQRFHRKGYVPKWVVDQFNDLDQSEQQRLFTQFKKEVAE